MRKQKVFFDSDVLLDVMLHRLPYFEDSQKVLALAEQGVIQGFTSALILANCYYILETYRDEETARKAVRKIRSLLTILSFTEKEVDESLNSGFRDFEDGVQYFIAQNNGVETILTRNINDFKKASLNILSPPGLLNLEAVKKTIEKAEA